MVERQREACARLWQQGLTCDVLPTVRHVAAQFAAAKPNRAFGEDGLTGELFRTFPWLLARVFHP
eukprot:1604708-Lingulodinium_polyedra.AAC.1